MWEGEHTPVERVDFALAGRFKKKKKLKLTSMLEQRYLTQREFANYFQHAYLLVFSRIRPRRAVSRTEGFEQPRWLICFTHACFGHKTSPSEISE